MSEEQDSNRPESKLRSLSFVTALWMAVAIALAMTGYAVFQKVIEPQASWRDLLVHHLWHVIVLGGVIHLACWLVFRRLLGEPLNRIYVHLYAVGKGQLGPLRVDSYIREIRSIVEGVNLMIWRMGRGYDPKALPQAQEDIRTIREQVRELSAHHPDACSAVAARLVDLEKNILGLAQVETQQPPATAK